MRAIGRPCLRNADAGYDTEPVAFIVLARPAVTIFVLDAELANAPRCGVVDEQDQNGGRLSMLFCAPRAK